MGGPPCPPRLAGKRSILTGSATIYLMVAQGVWHVFRINDTNPSAICSCGP